MLTSPVPEHEGLASASARTIFFMSGHPYMQFFITLNEQSNVSIHVHTWYRIAETLDELVFEDLPVMCLPVVAAFGPKIRIRPFFVTALGQTAFGENWCFSFGHVRPMFWHLLGMFCFVVAVCSMFGRVPFVWVNFRCVWVFSKIFGCVQHFGRLSVGRAFRRTAQHFALFPPPAAKFVLSSLSWGSSRGILVVCLKRWGPDMCTIGFSGCRRGFTRQPESPNGHI